MGEAQLLAIKAVISKTTIINNKMVLNSKPTVGEIKR
jgi:hypothetical protein